MSNPFQIIRMQSPEDLAGHPAPLLPEFDAVTLVRQRVDLHLMVKTPDGTPVARTSLWWKDSPAVAGSKLGCIGHFAAVDAAAATAVLDAACGELAAQGCTLAVGPMDGNTWRRYRFITERGEERPFLMEPDNPDEWPRFWAESGFEVLELQPLCLRHWHQLYQGVQEN